jgi:Leucine-rich repeat (LRR) protein
MKKLILLFLVLVLKFAPAKAQWVTIPDANFVTKLQQLFPSCMNGNQMDTTCAAVVNATSLFVPGSNISNLSGIEYFNNLSTLNCSDNQLASLPSLTNSLTTLDCAFNQLLSLPSLPNSITTLWCYANQLSSLPSLPNSLIGLHCYTNQLNILPDLPNNITTLWCYANQLSSLPNLPNSLINLNCRDNQLTSLPNLPNNLTTLNCYNNQLTNLPSLPNNLSTLNCDNNQLNSLPEVPDSMQVFRIVNNNISCLENLPYLSNPNLANISNNPFTCVPNQTTYSLGLPLCLDGDPLNNPNNCPSVNITGSVYTESSENSYSLYPNPSTGVFTFKDTKNLNSVEVYSILGEKILSQTYQKTINLNGFSKGVYFARVNGMQVVKMLKE